MQIGTPGGRPFEAPTPGNTWSAPTPGASFSEAGTPTEPALSYGTLVLQFDSNIKLSFAFCFVSSFE